MRGSTHLLLVALIAGAAALVVTLAERSHERRQRIEQRAAWATRGDPHAGPRAFGQYGCGGCHDIPGVTGATGLVGPPLLRFSQRTFIAGELRNTPENLVRWIMHPHAVEPKTAMPEMHVTERDARDMAAYLYTLGATE